MSPFSYAAPTDMASALSTVANDPGTAARQGARFLAGGTNLIDLMKERVETPRLLVDINGLDLHAIAVAPGGGLHLGALARNADTANHALVRDRYPLLRAAILAGASPQIRNMATTGGNLLQRTRCVYFYDVGVPCNKRLPGSGCPAAAGLSRQHAILGGNEHCIATHPSDMCVALAALQAVVHVRSQRGPRAIAFADLHRLPGDSPEIDTTVAGDELITHVELPPAEEFARHFTYLKIRERASYAFALVSVAAAIDLSEDGTVRAARLALGGVAHKPWRSLGAEACLVGRPANSASFGAAADLALAGARPWGGSGAPGALPGNAFKMPLARRAIVRALQMAVARIASNTGEDGARSQPVRGGPGALP